jgi:hypothetical protein
MLIRVDWLRSTEASYSPLELNTEKTENAIIPSTLTFGIFSSCPWLYGAQVKARNEMNKIRVKSRRVDDAFLDFNNGLLKEVKGNVQLLSVSVSNRTRKGKAPYQNLYLDNQDFSSL